MRDAIIAAVTLYVGFIGALYFMQSKLIYHPPKLIKNAHDNVHIVKITTDNGLQLRAKYKQAETQGKPVILIFHGNAEDVSRHAPDVDIFIEKGWGVLLAEYRGYFGNPGQPSEKNLKADALAYWNFLLEQNIQPENIIIYGRSLGSGIAAYLAHQKPASKGVIFVVPYNSLFNVASERYPFIPFMNLFMRDKYDSLEYIEDIKPPKLFIVAANDEVISPDLGIDLYKKALAPKKLEVISDAGHNTVYTHATINKITAFIEHL